MSAQKRARAIGMVQDGRSFREVCIFPRIFKRKKEIDRAEIRKASNAYNDRILTKCFFSLLS